MKPLVHGSLAAVWQEEAGVVPRREEVGESQQVALRLLTGCGFSVKSSGAGAQGLMDRGRCGTEMQPGG